MASCVHSESTFVLWEINYETDSLGNTITSKPFLLFNSEKTLQLRISRERCSVVGVGAKLTLLPNFDFSFNDIYILSLMCDESSVIHASSIVKADEDPEIWSLLCKGIRCQPPFKILCFFQCQQPDTQNNPQNEIIRLTTGQPNSLESLSSDFGRLLEDKTFSDVILKCRDRAIPAHRAVLTARSPAFAALLFGNKRAEESRYDIVGICNEDPDVLVSFLKYVYSGKLADQSEDRVSRLFSIGVKFKFLSLQQKCSSWISKNLNEKNWVCFLQLADTHHDEDLKMRVVEFIVKNSDAFKTEEWSKFKKLNPELALFVCEKYINIIE